jgi:Formin Homology 2 Domain
VSASAGLRLNSILFRLKYQDALHEIRTKLTELDGAYALLKSSTSLKCLLQHVLALGGFLFAMSHLVNGFAMDHALFDVALA